MYCFGLRQKEPCSVEKFLPVIGPLVLRPDLLLSKGCDDPPACQQSNLWVGVPCSDMAA